MFRAKDQSIIINCLNDPDNDPTRINFDGGLQYLTDCLVLNPTLRPNLLGIIVLVFDTVYD